MKNDKFEYEGIVKIIDKVSGKTIEFHNLLTNNFYYLASSLISGSSISPISYLAIGDGDGEPTFFDLVLENELYRTPIDSSSVDSNGTITLTIDISGSDAVFIWKEIGLFNASSSGLMTNRALVNPVFDHTTGNDIRIVYTISKE